MKMVMAKEHPPAFEAFEDPGFAPSSDGR